MTTSMLFCLIATIYIAPHVPRGSGLLMGMLMLVAGLVILILEAVK